MFKNNQALDPDPYLLQAHDLDPEPHLFETLDPDPHEINKWIRIRNPGTESSSPPPPLFCDNK